MSVFTLPLSPSVSGSTSRRGRFALKVAAAVLTTAAVAVVLIHAGTWGGIPVGLEPLLSSY